MDNLNLNKMSDKKFGIQDLSNLTGLSRRTIRYYIQMGLIPPPIGARKAAYYTQAHLERLLQIKRLTTEKFVPLERIKSYFEGEDEDANKDTPGELKVLYHITVGSGLTLVVDSQKSQLNLDQLKLLTEKLDGLVEKIKKMTPEEEPEENLPVPEEGGKGEKID